MGKWAFALSVLRQLPDIISTIEQILPGSGKGPDKKVAATSELTKYEGALALDQRVKAAKSALIDAQVEYMNAVDAAAAEATRLGIPVASYIPPPAPTPQAAEIPSANVAATAPSA